MQLRELVPLIHHTCTVNVICQVLDFGKKIVGNTYMFDLKNEDDVNSLSDSFLLDYSIDYIDITELGLAIYLEPDLIFI